MPVTVRRTRSRPAPQPEPTPGRRSRRTQPAGAQTNLRVHVEYIDINDIVPYDWNPRDNAAAVESVANSLKTFGFIIPVIIDNDNVLIAGHTRIEAAKTLRMTEVPAIKATHLSQDQINAFRIVDNKVAELAKWDFDLLSGEISKLSDSGLVLTDYGWTREELDCLSQMVQDDCLSTEGLVDLEAQERLRRAERRAPATARFVLGELVFFIPATDYRRWVDGIRTHYDYNEADIIAGLKERLGITEG